MLKALTPTNRNHWKYIKKNYMSLESACHVLKYFFFKDASCIILEMEGKYITTVFLPDGLALER